MFDDINQEKKRQDKIINYINTDIIPLFFEYNNIMPNDDLDQDNSYMNKEKIDFKEIAYFDNRDYKSHFDENETDFTDYLFAIGFNNLEKYTQINLK